MAVPSAVNEAWEVAGSKTKLVTIAFVPDRGVALERLHLKYSVVRDHARRDSGMVLLVHARTFVESPWCMVVVWYMAYTAAVLLRDCGMVW